MRTVSKISYPPVCFRPSSKLSVQQSHPNWIMVSELSPECWVVIETQKLELEHSFKRVNVFNVKIIDGVTDEVLSWYSQDTSYARSHEYYLEAIKVAQELYC